jgi:[ribosomal protein S18]-alanine N-acetyltransferase
VSPPDLAACTQPAAERLYWRVGEASDVPAIARFAADAFDPAFREAWTEPQIAAMVADPMGWLDVGSIADRGDSRLCAFALSRQILDDVELLLCATSADLRRQGIGRALIAEVCQSSRRRGAHRLFLEVRASNEAALGLYQSFGFVQAGRRPAYYRSVSGDSIDAITLAYPFGH